MLRAFFRKISCWIFSLSGWEIQGGFPDLKKYVVVVAPHTSWKDFVLGSFGRKCLGAEFINFVGKVQLFDSPFGWYFRWMGGYPVDRSQSHNLVDQIVDLFEKNEQFALTLAPEGTRRRVNSLKSGYYYVAVKAKVPILMVGFDYSAKVIVFSEVRQPEATFEQDQLLMAAFYKEMQGAVPEKDLTHLHDLLNEA